MTKTTGPTSTRKQLARKYLVRINDFRVMIVPGLHGSGPDHWQSRWQRLYPAFERVEQDRWDTPDLPVWSQRLHEVLSQEVLGHTQPVLIVAHSFGCLTTVHRAGIDSGNIAGALLVAPADPDKFHVAAEVRTRLPFPSLVVGSDNDPWMSAERAAYWAQIWGSDFVSIGAAGHINAESRLDDWLDGQQLLKTLAERMSTSLTSA